MFSVGILVFDGVGIFDFSGPYEVFCTAARISAGRRLFRCFLAAAEMRAIRVRGGMKILPDCVLPPPADIDILIVPGGDVSKVAGDAVLANWIRAVAASAVVTAAIHDGALLLGRDAAPQPGYGKVATCGDAATCVDISLRLVERLAGPQLAQATAQQMEYRWNAHGRDDPVRPADSRVFSAA